MSARGKLPVEDCTLGWPNPCSFTKNPQLSVAPAEVRKQEKTRVLVAGARYASRHLKKIQAPDTPHAADCTYLQNDSGASGTADHDAICSDKHSHQPDKADTSYNVAGATLQTSCPTREGGQDRSAMCIQYCCCVFR